MPSPTPSGVSVSGVVRWNGLSRFPDDGRIELDTNPVERAIRPVALGRKNHLFAGSDNGARRWATICSLVETAKLNNVEPFGYLAGVLQRMVDGRRCRIRPSVPKFSCRL